MPADAAAAEPAPRPKGFKLLAKALQNRKAACMLAFGFSSGLPFALLVGLLVPRERFATVRSRNVRPTNRARR